MKCQYVFTDRNKSAIRCTVHPNEQETLPPTSTKRRQILTRLVDDGKWGGQDLTGEVDAVDLALPASEPTGWTTPQREKGPAQPPTPPVPTPGLVNPQEEEQMQAEEDAPFLPATLNQEYLANFERGVANYQRFISACYRLTNESHWLNHGTREQPVYYLQSPGAEALMGPLGISFGDLRYRREEREDEKGFFYVWWCEGEAISKTLQKSGHYIGYCDSRDAFFNARKSWTPETGEGDIRKSAFSNWTVNAVTRLAGLRKPRPESLLAAGLDLTKIPAVDYSGRKTVETEGDVISEPQRKRLWAICKTAGVSEVALKDFLALGGYSSTAAIKKRDYDRICAWAGGKEEAERTPGQEG